MTIDINTHLEQARLGPSDHGCAGELYDETAGFLLGDLASLIYDLLEHDFSEQIPPRATFRVVADTADTLPILRVIVSGIADVAADTRAEVMPLHTLYDRAIQ